VCPLQTCGSDTAAGADAVVTIFHNPGVAYGRPSLISDLLTVPANPGQHQLENQATTVLAWLVDRSPAFAGARWLEAAFSRRCVSTQAPKTRVLVALTHSPIELPLKV
jgi:hypothetical protein